MKYLLDTNICIYILKRKPAKVFERFSQTLYESICVSVLSWAELMHGAAKSQDPERNKFVFREFIAPLNLLDFDAEAAAHYGDLRAFLERKGTPIGPLDLLIAAHARSRNLTLVTNNEREFVRVPGLTVENWTK